MPDDEVSDSEMDVSPILPVRIEVAPAGHKSRVYIAGVEQHNVRSLVLASSADGFSTLTLDLVNVQVSVTGDVYLLSQAPPKPAG